MMNFEFSMKGEKAEDSIQNSELRNQNKAKGKIKGEG